MMSLIYNFVYHYIYNLMYSYCLIPLGISSFIISFIISLISGKLFLIFLKKSTQSRVREFTPDTHLHKNNTPTMGGLFILLSSMITTAGFLLIHNSTAICIYLTLFLFGAIGLYDDWCKINKTRGISSKTKFILQWGSALLVLSIWVLCKSPSLTLALPFISPDSYPYLGSWFILWGAFVMVATSNAVNLTDGLDGLATQSLIPNFFLLALLASVIPFSATSSVPIVCICYSLVGALCGFLWYNRQPARVFMGDVGSLPLGAALALLFLMVKKEYLLVFSGIVFVTETVSVMIQVYGYKYLNRRIFKMAPFHHHLELHGWGENKIVRVLSLITLMGCSLAWVIK